jgi:uncharacterized membrane protein
LDTENRMMSTKELTLSALMLAMIAAAASARADTVSPAAPEALAAYDYEKDKARANFESARDRCAEEPGAQANCVTRARAEYKARMAVAQKTLEGQAAGGQPLANMR